jgi:hypothetical protein
MPSAAEVAAAILKGAEVATRTVRFVSVAFNGLVENRRVTLVKGGVKAGVIPHDRGSWRMLAPQGEVAARRPARRDLRACTGGSGQICDEPTRLRI